jgi:hypothetical protein
MKRAMRKSLVNKIVYTAAVFFLIAGIAIVLHHHDIPPKLAGCKICNLKYSFNAPSDKKAIDSSLAVAISYARLREILPVIAELAGDEAYPIPFSTALLIDLNKSPPVCPA